MYFDTLHTVGQVKAELSPQNQARLDKCLDKVSRWPTGTMSLRSFLAANQPAYKTVYVQKYASREVCLNRPKLKKPRSHYTLWFARPDSNDSGFDVPKIVWDSLTHVPTR